MKKWPILACFFVSGCGTMLPGTLHTAEGRVLDFQIEQSSGQGRVSAFDAQSGERFAGSYSGVLPRSNAISTTLTSAGTRVSTSQSGANLANASAFLKGDKGTMLTCEMVIEAGFRPHGLGDCKDNHGTPYKLQF